MWNIQNLFSISIFLKDVAATMSSGKVQENVAEKFKAEFPTAAVFTGLFEPLEKIFERFFRIPVDFSILVSFSTLTFNLGRGYWRRLLGK